MQMHHDMKSGYKMFGLELLLEAALMYFVMFAMVDLASRIHLNTNTLYMTIMMAAPMGIIMLLFMRHMFPNKKLNLMLHGTFVLLFLFSFYAIRTQAFVGDEQFLRAMIPHHSGAVLMCQEAEITDPEIKDLCTTIIDSQTREINQMEEILKRY